MMPFILRLIKILERQSSYIKNPRVALCYSGIQVEGKAEILGLVIDEPGRQFEKLYQKYLWEAIMLIVIKKMKF